MFSTNRIFFFSTYHYLRRRLRLIIGLLIFLFQLITCRQQLTRWRAPATGYLPARASEPAG
jgi:hypothetical protein